jgi:putative hydrolase of the HAD superfamily
MKAALFDLDNTLYAPERNLFALIDVRINRYMREVVKIAPERVDGLRRDYWKNYGATLQGLIRHHRVDAEDYLDYVHDVDVHGHLSADPALGLALQQLPIRRYVFTNGSRAHAERVLRALGLEGLFEEIFDIRIANYQPKPNVEPYRGVLRRLNRPAKDCIMIEDSGENLKTARRLGMKTMLVGAQDPCPHADHQATDACQAVKTLGALLSA